MCQMQQLCQRAMQAQPLQQELQLGLRKLGGCSEADTLMQLSAAPAPAVQQQQQFLHHQQHQQLQEPYRPTSSSA